MKGAIEGIVGQQVYCRIIEDEAKGPGFYKAVSVRREREHEAILARERATELASRQIEAASELKQACEKAEDASNRAQ